MLFFLEFWVFRRQAKQFSTDCSGRLAER